MNSPHISDILSDLSLRADEKLASFQNESEHIVDYLKEGNTDNFLQMIDIFQSYFRYVSQVSNLPPKLSYFVQNLNVFFCQNTCWIDTVLSDDFQEEMTNQIVKILKLNIHILNCIDELISNLSIHQCDIENIGETFTEVISLILIAFQHCRKYDSIYKQVDATINEEITRLFQKCSGILIPYFSILSKLKVDFNCEKQVLLITTLLYKIFDVGVAVSSLHLKTMALVWKEFTSLLKSYNVFLKEFDSFKIIQFFCNEIMEKVASMYDNPDTVSMTITMKILCFSLKIIVKLCDYFSDGLKKSFKDITELILFLYDHSTYYAKYNNINVELSSAIDRFLLPGLDPLLSILVCNTNFVEYFTSMKTEEMVKSRCKVGILLLLSVILEKIVAGSEDLQKLWLECSILDYTFSHVLEYYKMLCFDLRISTACADATLSQQVYLYDALVINVSSMIINCVPREKFSEVEDMLIQNLLRSPLMMKLFVSDVWCVVARFGSSELCFTHVDYLIFMWHNLQSVKTESTIVLSLIKRLFKFLPFNYQQKIMESVSHYSNLLTELQKTICTAPEQSSRSVVKCIIEDVLSKMNNDEGPVSQGEEVENLLNSLSMIQNISTINNDIIFSKVKEFLMNQWQVLIQQLTLSNFDSMSRFANYFTALCFLISNQVSMYSAVDILTLLEDITGLLKSECSFVRLNLLLIFRGMSHCFFSTVDKSLVLRYCNCLALAFKICLKDRFPVVKQRSIETFIYFSHTTKYDMVIQKTTDNDLLLKEILSSYLQKKLTPMHKSVSFEHFMLQLFDSPFTDIHQRNNDVSDEANIPKKLKLDNSIRYKIDLAESVINDLLNSVNVTELDEEEKNRLRKIIQTINQFQIYF